MSDVTPELNQLACELSSLTWDEVTSLAVQLGVEFSTLRQIGQGHHKPNVCALEAMTEWLNNDLDASWNKLISALKTIKKNVLADSLEKKYCSPATDLTEDKMPSLGDTLKVLEEKLTSAEETIRRQQQLIQELRQQEAEKDELVKDKDRELALAEQQVKQLRQQEAEKDELVKAKDRELAQAEQQVKQLRQQETKKDELIQMKDNELTQAQQQLKQLREQHPSDVYMSPFQSSLQAVRPVAVSQSIPPSKHRKLTVQLYRRKAAPHYIGGSATTDGQFAYFRVPDSDPSTYHLFFPKSIYRYEWNTAKWEELPSSPYSNSGLVIIDGELTAVGGYDTRGSGCTSQLFTLQEGQWVEHYPPMNTSCQSPVVVSTSDGNYIVVVVGSDSWTTTVDVFHVKIRTWCEVEAYLPPPLPQPSATICGDQLHVVGHDDVGYSCSLQDLLSSYQPNTSQSTSHNVMWTPLPQLPVENPTVATLSGQLVVVGRNQPNQSRMESMLDINSIYQLLDRQWVEIGSISFGAEKYLLITPSPNKMMIVGGQGHGPIDYPSQIPIEECVVV